MKNKRIYRPAHIYKLIASISDVNKRNLLRGYGTKVRLSSEDVAEIRMQNSLRNSVISGAVLKGPQGLWDGHDQTKKKTSYDLSKMTSFPSLPWRNEVCYSAGYINSFLTEAKDILNIIKSLAHLEALSCDEALEILLNLSTRSGASNFLSYKLAYLRSARNLDTRQIAKVNNIEEQIAHRANVGVHFSALENLGSKISLFDVARRRVAGLVGKVDGNVRKAISLNNFIPTPLNDED